MKGVEKTEKETKFNKDHPAFTWNKNSNNIINIFTFFYLII